MKKGFTLIELLVVVAIVGVLASIILVSLNTSRMKARDTRRMTDFRELRKAIELYYNDFGSYPQPGIYWATSGATTYDSGSGWTTLESLLSPYIDRLPRDPKPTGTSGPWYSGNHHYAYGSNGQVYDLVAQLEDSNSPYRCTVKQWKYHRGEGGIPPESSWCGSYHANMYADH